jgi:hypothetical protein
MFAHIQAIISDNKFWMKIDLFKQNKINNYNMQT